MLSAILAAKQPAIKQYLAQFKDRGRIVYSKTLQVPTAQRLPALTASRQGRFEVCTALCACLKQAFDHLNLRVTVNEAQVLDIAEAIIDESGEDNLALEDVLLFLNQMVLGRYGKLYDRLDMPTFFEQFEAYREQRHQALMHLRYEQSAQHQAMGDPNRWSENHDGEYEAHRSAMADYLKTQYAQNIK